MADDTNRLASLLAERDNPSTASVTGSWDAPSPSRVGAFLDALRAHLREKGEALAEQGHKPAGEQASDFVYHLPVVGSARRAYDSHNEGHNGLATAGYSALAGLEALPFLAPAARGLTSAVNGMRPGVVGTTTKGATAQYMGGSGVRSTMPEDMDAGLRAYVEGTRAYPQAQAAFQQAQRDYPAQIARAIALEKEMGTPTTGRGMARNRQLQAMVEERMPSPTAPRRPEEPGFVRGQDPDRMYEVMNQPPTLAAVLAGMGLTATATGAPRELASDAAHKVGGAIHEWATRPPIPHEQRDYSSSPYRLEESPEARDYQSHATGMRYVRNGLIGASGIAGVGAAATLPLLKEVTSPFAMLAGSALDSPALMLLGAGPAAVPVALGAGSIAAGVGAHGAHKRMKEYQRLLDANYRRDQPAMEQGPITDY